ncbi:MAG TPA: cellulase family glycosylhydrolase [Acetobacteraceae bacterium]|nr:cellulase family glycosylhydrolase [Acetobacteraceae bacterium]
MIRRRILLLLACCVFGWAARADAPADRVARLGRGINLTNWFRFPPSLAPDALRTYLSDAVVLQLRRAGFTAVRLSVQPALFGTLPGIRLLTAAVRRLQQGGLAVVVAAHPDGWHLETSANDRARLLAFWSMLAPALGSLDVRLTFPELLNEPVFPGNPEAWRRLQHTLLETVRSALPEHTIVLSGNDWGSIAGLLALRPEADPNVIYSIHYYDPPELTSLAAYRPGLDRASLADLPFPAANRAACFQVAARSSDPATAALIRFYCGLHWDAARIASRFAAAASWARRNHASLLLGEFGASAALNPLARLNWLSAVRRQAEAAKISWMLWGYDDVMGFALSRPPPARPVLDTAVLRALGLTGR